MGWLSFRSPYTKGVILIMRLVLDVENTVTKRGGKTHLDPFEPTNTLTQVGVQNLDNPDEQYVMTFDHVEYQDISGDRSRQLQAVLDRATLLVMHNAQHDLMWLWASGFKYDGDIYDTMLAEYVLLRGQKRPLSLSACVEYRELEHQKDDTLKAYFKDGYNTNEIPLKELSFYLECDLNATASLYHSIEKDYNTAESESLHNIRDITFKVCKTLTRMYMTGIKIDTDVLNDVRKEFEEEKAQIETRLNRTVHELMGDTPINLNSGEQMSKVLFSRTPLDKKTWVTTFESVSPEEFKDTLNTYSSIISKTKASICLTCRGKGKVFKTKKDGKDFKKPSGCTNCSAKGYVLTSTGVVAGFKLSPRDKSWVNANGFKTGKDSLDVLISTARNNNMSGAVLFIQDVKRLSALTSYLSTFVEGISIFTKQDGLLHVGLTQHVSATGRFSGRNPNMQNMPRGNTFPVKKVFVSRWDGGHILEADFAQLEFRVAAHLSADKTAIDEINTGFDVHSYTAKVISDAGQKTSRQEAKAHTFAPLFGASGWGRSRAEAAYYTHFNDKYSGISTWHKSLAKEALATGKITNVSGRQYAFPDVQRRARGKVSHFTMIKNYPVQGLATADIVPVVVMELEERLRLLQSCLVNTVHDSAVVDVHPDETKYVLQIIDDLNKDLDNIIHEAYGIEMCVPMLLEAKIGDNWLDTLDVV